MAKMEDVKIREVKKILLMADRMDLFKIKLGFFFNNWKMRILTLDITHLLAHYNIKTYKEQNSFNEDLC